MLSYSKPDVQWYLEGIAGDGKTWIVPVDKSPFIIGRSEECNLALSSRTISRKHAEFSYQGNSLLIKDLNSTNGTFINDKRLKDSFELNDGDTIYFGDTKFRIYSKKYEEDEEEVNTGTMHLKIPQKSQNFSEYYELTKREEEILYQLIQGKSTKMIADVLYISLGTAKNHVSNIFKKTQVHSRFELLTLYNNFYAERSD